MTVCNSVVIFVLKLFQYLNNCFGVSCYVQRQLTCADWKHIAIDSALYLELEVTFQGFWVLTVEHLRDEYRGALHGNVLKKYGAYERAEVACCSTLFQLEFLKSKNIVRRDATQRWPSERWWRCAVLRLGPLWSSGEVSQFAVSSRMWCFGQAPL